MIGSPETGLYKRQLRPMSIFDRSLIVPAIGGSFRKLDPRTLVKNPVMFCVEIVAALTTIFFLRDLIAGNGTVIGTSAVFSGQITLWLWFTVLFANFAEAVAEGRGKAQADALRRTRTRPKPSDCIPPPPFPPPRAGEGQGGGPISTWSTPLRSKPEISYWSRPAI